MNSQNVPTGMTEDQWVEIANTMSELIPEMSLIEAQYLIGDKGQFGAGIRRAFEPFIQTKSVLYWLDEMARFYKVVFNLDCDYSEYRAPVSREGFNWMLVADHRVTTEGAFRKCSERFGAGKPFEQSLDADITTNDRSENDGDYVIWLRDTVEADEIYENRSADALQAAGINGITVRERLILGLWYEWKNPGQHLDTQGWTLCSGSRTRAGSVVDVAWHPSTRQLRVNWQCSTLRRDSLSCREVVA